MAGKTDDRLIAVGVLKGAHGVRGEVRMRSLTADPEAVFSYGPLLDAAGGVILTPKSIRPGKDHFIVQPEESLQKEAWDALRGTFLHVPRAALPAAGDDEFYVEDLVGLNVHDASGAAAGRIRAVQNYGAGDLLEIEVTGQPGTVFVPLTLADVPVINIAARRVDIPGLADWASAPDPET